MKKNTAIHHFNIFYLLLKLYQILVFHLYYKKVVVIGNENIPRKSPVIFTPNHQNALMDALIVLNTCGLNPVFLARADIFKKNAQRKVLNFLKILPIYRIRDGADELSKNDETFTTCLDILRDCHSICLMPEGNHGHHRRLRTLVKGTFRIAFQAQEEFGSINSVKIVPVGLDFEHYQNHYQDLLVIYGEPIDISDYIVAYRENQPKAINALKERLSDELKKLIIHIENIEFHDTFQHLREIFNGRMRKLAGIKGDSLYDRFLADKEMIRALDQELLSNPQQIVHLSALIIAYTEGVNKLRLRDWVIDRNGFSVLKISILSIFIIIMFPFFAIGLVANLIPYYIPLRMVGGVKDPQFVSSFKFGIGLVALLLFYLVTGVISWVFTASGIIALVILIGMLTTGVFAVRYSFVFKKLRAAIRFRLLLNKGDSTLNNVLLLHKEIIDTMNTIVNPQ
jgi:1-acyl-sn-glycerol-3-phosphate acyltransferase